MPARSFAIPFAVAALLAGLVDGEPPATMRAPTTTRSATTIQVAPSADLERILRIERGTTRPATPKEMANDAALRDAVLARVLANRRGSNLDFYGTPGAHDVVLFGEAVGATLPDGWTSIDPAADKAARATGPRLLGITMHLSTYVLGDGETRVVRVDVFNAGGSANGGVMGFDIITFHAFPEGAGWHVKFFMAMS